MAVEGDCCVVPGIDPQRKHADLGTGGANGCVGQQGAAQLLSVEDTIDCEAAYRATGTDG